MNFKKSLACTLAVLLVSSSSPISPSNLNVYAAETSVSSSVPSESQQNNGESFKDKIWGFVKRNKGKIILTALAVAGSAFIGYKIYKHYKARNNEEASESYQTESVSGSSDINDEKEKMDESSENPHNDTSGEKKSDEIKTEVDNEKEKMDEGIDERSENPHNDTSGEKKSDEIKTEVDNKNSGIPQSNISESNNRKKIDDRKKTIYGDAENWITDKTNKVVDTRVGHDVVFGVSLAGIALTGISSFCKSARDFAKNVGYVLNPYGFFGEVYDQVKRKLDDTFNPKEPITLKNSMENLEEMFKSVEGQELAKEKLRGYVTEIVTGKDAAVKNNKAYDHGDVLYFIGPTGVGKSLMAKGLGNYHVLGNEEIYSMCSSDVDLKNKDKESLVTQLFGPKRADYYGYGYGNNDGAQKQSSMYRYIKNNPNGIVIIDEYDKIYDEALDEVMRGIMDNGKVRVCGQDLDCSGITFILTSNETKASLGIKSQEEYHRSLTTHKHDQSLLNRFKIVEFENLPLETYKDIARSQFVASLKSYFAHEDAGGVNLVVGEDTIEELAKKTRAYGDGARHMVRELHGAATLAISRCIAGKSNEDFKNAKGKDLELKYVLEDVPEKEKQFAIADVEGKTYKIISGAYKYRLDDIDPDEIGLVEN